ncbi:2-dehydro-3-deoxygalactonokinase [Brevibacterium epidermidis]|uniref:2-dehydro-3-deoxygalactonokinase n=1 Tax=Brevibacterium epidermidis TaxID=1698 RepID=UPI001428A19A|nr:2-dehydro-3-deoxygalactonokinase [Brevibacterium epidermidis]
MANLAPPEAPQMIGLDWGTSSLRAFLIDSDGQVLAERNGSDGIMAVSSDTTDLRGDFSRIAEAAVGDWLTTYGPLPMLACGMIGSTQGVAEAGYLDLPADLSDMGRRLTTVELTTGDLHIVPGLQKAPTEATAPDVIRGEETQLLGLLGVDDTEPSTVILPGTHTKWVSCHGQRVTDFTTSMSGELFGLLSTSSILGRLAEPTAGFHSEAFDWGLSVGADDPAAVTSSIFSARTWALDGRLRAEEVNDYLSGMLIGAEVAHQLAVVAESSAPVIVCGTTDLTKRYTRALHRAGRETINANPRAAATGLFRIAVQSGLVPTKEHTHA